MVDCSNLTIFNKNCITKTYLRDFSSSPLLIKSDDFLPKDCLTSFNDGYGIFMDLYWSCRRYLDGMVVLCGSDVQEIEEVALLRGRMAPQPARGDSSLGAGSRQQLLFPYPFFWGHKFLVGIPVEVRLDNSLRFHRVFLGNQESFQIRKGA